MVSETLATRVLLIEDSREDAELILRMLSDAGMRPEHKIVSGARELRKALACFKPDILLSDYSMPGFSGSDAMKIARERHPNVPFVFVSGTIGEERAIELLKQGATDYVLKANLDRLVPAVKRALQEARERIARERAQLQLAAQYAVARIFAETGSAEESIPRFLQTICEQLGFAVGVLWEIRRSANTCRCAGAWHRDSAVLAEFAAKTREITALSPAGILGQVLQSGRPTWLENVIQDPRFIRAPQATKAGLHSMVAFPIVLQDKTTGIMEFFSAEARAADPGLLDMFVAISSQIGQSMERYAQQAQIARLNRVHAVLSGINSTIVRARERQELFKEACRIAVEHGGFGMSWVSEFDPVTLDVTPVAWAGVGAPEIAQSKSSARADSPLGQGVNGRAIRAKAIVACNDLAAESDVGSSKRREALRRGYRSLVAIPLFEEGAVTATLTLYAKEVNFFNEDETKLLGELGADLSFALEFIAKRQQLDYLAQHDALTGVANRALLNDRLTQAMAQARRYGRMVAVAVLDLDNFKLVNDSLGHQWGDQLLKMVASRLNACVRLGDTVARLAGDEFVLVLPAISRAMERISGSVSADASIIKGLKRIIDAVSEPMVLDDREILLTCSIGVSLYPQDGEDVGSLLKNATAALARAKQLGRRIFQFYTAELNARVAERLSLHSSLRRALERDEFTLFYQPKINLQTDEISGVEALLRWNKPGAGIVPPGAFISALEETGLIIEVGRWGMEKAVEQYRIWQKIWPAPPRIAVNVSQLQLAQKDFPTVVEKILGGDGGNPAGGLDIEITESLIMHEVEANIPKLNAIKKLGVKVAIDDFGTGYSSLSHLIKLPVDTLKIDRAFIEHIADAADALSIITAIISLAHSMNLKVVAEGVENDGQLKMLRLLSCDEIQGYVIARPLPADEYEQWCNVFKGKT